MKGTNAHNRFCVKYRRVLVLWFRDNSCDSLSGVWRFIFCATQWCRCREASVVGYILKPTRQISYNLTRRFYSIAQLIEFANWRNKTIREIREWTKNVPYTLNERPALISLRCVKHPNEFKVRFHELFESKSL